MVFTAIMTSFQCGNSITPPYLIVLKTHSDQAHSDFCNTNIAFDNDMTVELFEMKAVIDDLASNKSPGWTDFLQNTLNLHTPGFSVNVYACMDNLSMQLHNQSIML